SSNRRLELHLRFGAQKMRRISRQQPTWSDAATLRHARQKTSRFISAGSSGDLLSVALSPLPERDARETSQFSASHAARFPSSDWAPSLHVTSRLQRSVIL